MKAGILVAALVLLAGCASRGDYFRDAGPAPAVAPARLAAWPQREVWTGIVFNGEKIGFAHRTVSPVPGAPGRYRIESEAALRLNFLGFDKRIALHAIDRVREDLTLEAFEYRHEIDGSVLALEGSSDGRELRFTVRTSAGREERRLPLSGALYASSALALLPLAEGLRIGRKGRYAVFHGETQAIEAAEQEVSGFETSTLFDDSAFKVETRLLGLETTTWFAADGRPLLELGLRGVMISALEDEQAARRYLVEASLNKHDALLDFSLVPSPPLAEPRRVARLAIALEGLPAGFAVPSEGGQHCMTTGGVVECRIDRSQPLAQGSPDKYLASTLAAPSHLLTIRKLAGDITAGAAGDEERVRRLVAWMDANIAKEVIDAFNALDVLEKRSAECQGHAYLLAAFARSLGLPARVVNGIAYSEAQRGFLYHTWNEVWIAGRGWLPVDATFGQTHADATHVKLVEGETLAELAPLVNLVGRLRAPRLAALGRW